MGKKLVIVESPAKAKTINKILGGDFVVKASMGHIRDLPIKKIGVDIARDFKPQYEVVKGREKVVHELLAAASGCAAVYLAPDPDREGEAIAWHLQALLQDKVPADKFHRVTYNEITPRAVRAAFEHPKHIDQNLVDAQQARRVLDRIVGYKVSPLLWSRVRRGLSAGRVQSVALRLVCEREQAIRSFTPEEYWLMGAEVRKLVAPLDPFSIRLARINGEKAEIKNAAQAEAISKELEHRALKVKGVIRREIFKRTFPPYITSSLQQAASRLFDYAPARTMKIAQKLYEGVDLGEGPAGLITYMRTDSFTVSQDAQAACRQFIERQFGRDYLPEKPNFFRSRSSAQEAHEAIRPTDVSRTPESLAGRLTPEEHKIYVLIWQRFVASQMAPARIEQRTAEVETAPRDGAGMYLFRATASEVVFPGYMKASGFEQKAKSDEKQDKEKEGAEEEPEVDRLPPLAEGEPLEVLKWLSDRKETQPPNRYSEATLIRTLEENGVGRPSTYASILATLFDRRYVIKEKRTIQPTELGERVNAFLVEHLNQLFDVKFTAEMEESLDAIEKGSVEWTAMLSRFYEQFAKWMVAARGPTVEPGKIHRILAVLDKVQEWGPETQRGKKVYSDRKFVESLRKQLVTGAKGLSQRQLESMGRLVMHYRAQLGEEVQTVLTELDLGKLLHEALPEPPKASTLRKLAALRAMTFDAPTERRGRTFDDGAFVASLQQQADRGRSLSPAQIRVLDRLVVKYADRIPDFETVRHELDLGQAEAAPDTESGPLLELMQRVVTWHPPVVKGKRTLDDKAFYESLARQYAVRKSLTPRQQSALKRMVKKYTGHKKANVGSGETT
jgi:DNA topoisomerase I